MLCLAFQLERRLGKLGLALPLLMAVGLVVRQIAVVAVGPTGAIAVVAEHRAARLVDRYLVVVDAHPVTLRVGVVEDRKSTRLNSSHVAISYAVFCLKKKS